jgi:hypothetical protein
LKCKAYRVFNHANDLVEETYNVELYETNDSQGAYENLDNVGDELLKETMKNMLVRAIKPKEDEYDVQVINMPSSSDAPQHGDKDGRQSNKDTYVSQDQMMEHVQDVDAPKPTPQVVQRKSTSLLQAHSQDLIIWSPSMGVMTCSRVFVLFVENHSFDSCIMPIA